MRDRITLGRVAAVWVSMGMLVLLNQLGLPTVSAADPEVIPATECTVSPLIEADLVAAAALPAATPTSTDLVTATGETADDETVDAITRVIRESVACANANDFMRSLALFTPHYLQVRFSGEPQDDLGHVLASLSRTPGPVGAGDLLTLVAISDVIVLPDGRVAAIVETSNAANSFRDTIILSASSGTWLIDEVLLAVANETPEATP